MKQEIKSYSRKEGISFSEFCKAIRENGKTAGKIFKAMGVSFHQFNRNFKEWNEQMRRINKLVINKKRGKHEKR